jgi:hypothetical protein
MTLCHSHEVQSSTISTKLYTRATVKKYVLQSQDDLPHCLQLKETFTVYLLLIPFLGVHA